MLQLSLKSFGHNDNGPMYVRNNRIVSSPLDLVAGKYFINLEVVVKTPIALNVSSTPLLSSVVVNGKNKIVYAVPRSCQGTITISSRGIDYQIVSISAEQVPSSRPVAVPRPIVIRSLQQTGNALPRVMLVIDDPGWCFHQIAKRIISTYSDRYEFDLVCSMKHPNYRSMIPPSMIVKFWYGYDHLDPFEIFPQARRVTCVYDYHHWNPELTNLTNSSIYQSFRKNLSNSHVITYSCGEIYRLLQKNVPGLVADKVLIQFSDGVDENLFQPSPHVSESRLVVGWVGNSLNKTKRFAELQSLLAAESWIEFVTQTKSSACSQDQMPQFYSRINVLVCGSRSEGTPNPILEAAACGRAWVSTRVGIVEELNQGSPSGIIVDRLEDIVPALRQLHENRSLLEELSSAGRAAVVDRFKWSERLNSFESFFGNQSSPPPVDTSEGNCALSNVPTVDTSAKRVQTIITRQSGLHTYLVTSTQYPRYGGAATCAYEMHRYLLSLGEHSSCVFFDNTVRGKPELYNPDNLPRVYQHKLAGGASKTASIKYDDLQMIGTPTRIFAFNYLAPVISKHVFPGSSVYYMVTGCSYINNKNLVSVADILRVPFPSEKAPAEEKLAIQVSDRTIPNTPLMKNLLEHIHGVSVGSPIDLHEIFALDVARPEEKEYDLIFISSDLNRGVKNPELLRQIYHSPALSGYRKLVVGKNSEAIIGSNSLLKIECRDFVGQQELHTLLSKSRLVIVCSLIESYSIVAVEAAQLGTIVLASSNTACSGMMHRFFVVDSYHLDDWVERCATILDNYSYYRAIFRTSFFETPPIKNLLADGSNSCYPKVVFVSVDIPYIGGCATNTYRMIKAIREKGYPSNRVHGIYVCNMEGNANPEDIPNIHRIPYGKDTRQGLIDVRRLIESDGQPIDRIFLKNYKLFPFVQNVMGDIKIIFSPSGLRSVSSSGHRTDGYITDATVIKMDNIQDPFLFVRDNDAHLDDYAIKNADLVIPNSRLTHQFIATSLPDMPYLHNSIYITNVCFDRDHIPSDSFREREYDLVFCSYEWKRACKGYGVVSSICGHPSMVDKKIVVIGSSQKGPELPNVTRHVYLPNEEVLQILRRSRILVIPSVFDSNPNVLVEAVLSGCNVVTTRRVGNHENLHSDCVVNNRDDPEEWIRAIQASSHERLPYSGPCCGKIVENLLDLFRPNPVTTSAVAVYKIPPAYSTLANCAKMKQLGHINFRTALDEEVGFARKILEHDIYFHLFHESARKRECGVINYLVFDETIDMSYYVNLSRLDPTYPRTSCIWKIKNIESFGRFRTADYYFLRGTYYEFFKALVRPGAFSVFYSATSFKQELPGKDTLPATTPLTDQIFDIVLTHESDRYRVAFPARNYVLFNKFVCDTYHIRPMERIYDICFVATENQATKNHELFFDLIEYLEHKKRHTKLIYVGNMEQVIARYAPTFRRGSLTHVELSHRQELGPDEMSEVYNQSRINILFSGRDAFPRVTGESSACGCYNVALDTLSDGKNFYKEPLGRLIGSFQAIVRRKVGSSLSYVSSPLLWEQVEAVLDQTFDHSLISSTYLSEHNLSKVIRSLPL